MRISAQSDLIVKLQSFRIGVITSAIRCEPSTKVYCDIIDSTVNLVRGRLKLDEIKSQEIISATRSAYKKIGNDPNRYRPSADALLRRIVKGNNIYRINNVVDTLNLISIQSGFSIGGYDTEKIVGNIELGIGNKDEVYNGIGRGKINIANLMVLRDNDGPFGSPTSDSEKTMISTSTEQIIFILFDFDMHKSLEVTMDNCVILLKEYCNAELFEMKILKFP